MFIRLNVLTRLQNKEENKKMKSRKISWDWTRWLTNSTAELRLTARMFFSIHSYFQQSRASPLCVEHSWIEVFYLVMEALLAAGLWTFIFRMNFSLYIYGYNENRFIFKQNTLFYCIVGIYCKFAFNSANHLF